MGAPSQPNALKGGLGPYSAPGAGKNCTMLREGTLIRDRGCAFRRGIDGDLGWMGLGELGRGQKKTCFEHSIRQ